MRVSRGDVVLVDFPFVSGRGAKVRPALVVQNDRDNQRLANTIIAMVTSRTHRAAETTQLFIDINTPEGKQTGLIMDSVVNCINLFTLQQSKIVRKLGSLSSSHMAQVGDCLKAALELS